MIDLLYYGRGSNRVNDLRFQIRSHVILPLSQRLFYSRYCFIAVFAGFSNVLPSPKTVPKEAFQTKPKPVLTSVVAGFNCTLEVPLSNSSR